MWGNRVSHQTTLPILSPGTLYHYRVSSASAYGLSTSEDQTFSTSAPITPITLSITSPVDNGTVAKSAILVEGRVANGSGNETGVVVNGIVANIYAGEFVANHVPLAEGANVITATATDGAGNTATATINLTSVNVPNYIKITANSEVGLSPLEVVLTLDSSLPLTNASLTYTGPGDVELLSSSSNQCRVRMTTEGIYHYIAAVTDAGGTVYQDTIAVIVLSREELDALLQGKWRRMVQALGNRDIEGAMVVIGKDAQDIYRTQFTGLDSLLPQIANEMNSAQINLVKLSDNMAEYEILVNRDGEALSFLLRFIRDTDGIWKIWRF